LAQPQKAATGGLPAAVLVLTQVSSVRAGCRALRRARSMSCSDQPLPVISVLLGSTSSPNFEKEALQAQYEFLCSGADDVVVKCGTQADLSLAIAMAIMRTTMKRRERLHYEREAQQQERRALDEENPEKSMFWQSVHLVFEKFPPMNTSIVHDPGEGDRVGHLHLGRKLGEGSFGQVFSATNLDTGEHEAVKLIDKSYLTRLSRVCLVWKEREALTRANHENIVKFRGCLHGPTHIIIRMEMAGKRNLFQVLRRHPRGLGMKTTKQYQAQIASAVHHLQTLGLAHRDIKPENVAISQDGSLIKMLDFGSVVPLGRECNDMTGTMPFMAPEMLAADDKELYDPSTCDIWSSGVVLLEMLCGPHKLSRMLNWSHDLPPCPERCSELEAFFADPQALSMAIGPDIGAVDDSLLALLKGMLHLINTERWSAAQVTASVWLQN